MWEADAGDRCRDLSLHPAPGAEAAAADSNLAINVTESFVTCPGGDSADVSPTTFPFLPQSLRMELGLGESISEGAPG